MSSLFIRKHSDLWKSFEKRYRRVFCIILIHQYTDSWEKCSWGVGRLWAQRLSLTKSHRKTPSATTHKHFRIRRVGRITSSGVIYFIPECSFSLVFFVVSVSLVSSILSVLLTATGLPTLRLAWLKSLYAPLEVMNMCVCWLKGGSGQNLLKIFDKGDQIFKIKKWDTFFFPLKIKCMANSHQV